MKWAKRKETEWHSWFAWHPVDVLEGGVIWLERVDRRWNWEINYSLDMTGYGDYNGGWEYRIGANNGD